LWHRSPTVKCHLYLEVDEKDKCKEFEVNFFRSPVIVLSLKSDLKSRPKRNVNFDIWAPHTHTQTQSELHATGSCCCSCCTKCGDKHKTNGTKQTRMNHAKRPQNNKTRRKVSGISTPKRVCKLVYFYSCPLFLPLFTWHLSTLLFERN